MKGSIPLAYYSALENKSIVFNTYFFSNRRNSFNFITNSLSFVGAYY